MPGEMVNSIKLKLFGSIFWRNDPREASATGPEPAKLYVKFHERIDQIQCLWTNKDLGQGFDLPKDKSEEQRRARDFLRGLADIDFFNLGVPPSVFKTRLRLKHKITSLIGTRYIFSLHSMDNDAEIVDNSFIVHLDSQMNIVMAINIYEPDATGNALRQDSEQFGDSSDTGWSMANVFRKLTEVFGSIIEQLPVTSNVKNLTREEKRAVKTALNTYNQGEQPQGKLKSVIVADRIIKPHPQTPIRALQIKVSTDQGSFVWNVDNQGKMLRSPHANGAGIRLGYVYDELWDEKTPKKLDAIKPRRVILKELAEIQNELSGPYVKVLDQINPDWSHSEPHLLLDPDKWAFDRVMAYYHLDFIYHYFRSLDLEMLTDYEQLKPVRVALTDEQASTGSRYDTNDQQIYLRNIGADCTEARDPRVIYHEFVHVVTDALARLHRQNENDADNSRRVDMVQAMAIDEGLADYFACRLARRLKAQQPPHFGVLTLDDPDFKTFKLKEVLRNLEGPFNLGQLLEVKTEDLAAENIKSLKYTWGEQWGRYLWQLSSSAKLGLDADRVISHGILFLTRWSGFDMGILAIMIADHLLFGEDNHGDKIVVGTPLETIPAIDICDLTDDVPPKPSMVELTYTSLDKLKEQIRLIFSIT